MIWTLVEIAEIAVIIGLEVVTLLMDIHRDRDRKGRSPDGSAGGPQGRKGP